MKAWIKAIFFLNSKLGNLLDSIQDEMDVLSKNLILETFTLCDKMLKLEDKKRRICNLKVLHSLFKSKLSNIEYNLIKKHLLQGKTFEEISATLTKSKSQLSRDYCKALDKCEEVSIAMTFSEERLEREYKDIILVYKTVKKFR